MILGGTIYSAMDGPGGTDFGGDHLWYDSSIITAIKVGVPNLETDLFTNVNKLCPSCDTWSAQAWKLLGNVHMCPSQCPICACPVYKLGHSLYTGATAWTLLVH